MRKAYWKPFGVIVGSALLFATANGSAQATVSRTKGNSVDDPARVSTATMPSSLAGAVGTLYLIDQQGTLWHIQQKSNGHPTDQWVEPKQSVGSIGDFRSLETLTMGAPGVLYSKVGNRLATTYHWGFPHELGPYASVTFTDGFVTKYVTFLASESSQVYGIEKSGDVYWYLHDKMSERLPLPEKGIKVASGFDQYSQIISGGNDIIYALKGDTLFWYVHEGAADGTPQWLGPNEIGSGFGKYAKIINGGNGVIYGIDAQGDLFWHRHIGRFTGTPEWVSPNGIKVRSGLNAYRLVA